MMLMSSDDEVHFTLKKDEREISPEETEEWKRLAKAIGVE